MQAEEQIGKLGNHAFPYAPSFATHIMKITTESTLGNYKAIISVDANEALQAKLLPLGLKYVLQRQTNIDKVLGAFHIVDGKSKRKSGWKRNDVEYTESLASKLHDALSTLAMPDESHLMVDAEIEEYIREVAVLKYALAKSAMLRHESKNDLESWLEDTVGYDGDTHGEDGEYHVEALKAIDAYIKSI